MQKNDWLVYMLRCSDGSLYTGATNDVERRLKAHNDGKGGHYTRAHRPVELVYQENGMTHAQALSRECAIKALSKQNKEMLVR